MSLWPVSDYVTREAMTAYYTAPASAAAMRCGLRSWRC
jgi:hypothetical protein